MKLHPFAVSMLLPPPRPTDEIDARGARHLDAAIHIDRRRILVHLVENGDVQAGGLEEIDRARSVPGLDDARVRDQEHMLRAQFAREFADALERIVAKDQPGPGLMIEAGGLHYEA